MRVALLNYNARLGDAIGNQVAEKLQFFLDRGANVRVFLEDKQFLHPALADHCTLVAGKTLPAELLEWLASADLIIAEYGQYYPLLQWLPKLAGGKPKIVVDYHGVTPPELWGQHNRQVLVEGIAQRPLLGFADRVIVHSRQTEQDLSEVLNHPEQRLCKLGYPVEILPISESEAVAWRMKHGLPQATILLCVGRLAPSKRVPFLVEGLARLKAELPNVHLVVLGDKEDLYYRQAEECLKIARRLDIADRLHLLGKVEERELHQAYRAADILVSASLHEGFCIPVIEAQAHGLPVIACRRT
ncbi:MAG: glycosyltransferase family 4 protein, partial [Bdellovibrionales bacterium]